MTAAVAAPARGWPVGRCAHEDTTELEDRAYGFYLLCNICETQLTPSRIPISEDY